MHLEHVLEVHFLTCKINASGLNDKDFAAEIVARGEELVMKTVREEEEILLFVNSKISI